MALGVAALLVVAYVALAFGGSWSALMAFAFAWLVGIVALLLWALAAVAAATGRGRLPDAVLALGAIVFLAGAVLSAASLDVTGAPGLVATALVACVAGVVACAVAPWRARRDVAPARAPSGR